MNTTKNEPIKHVFYNSERKNAPIKRAGVRTKGRSVGGEYEFYTRTCRDRALEASLAPCEEIDVSDSWGEEDVDVYNDTFGSSSIKKIIGEFSRNNCGIKYLNQLEIAQKLTRSPEEDYRNADIEEQTIQGHAEQEAIQSIITSSKRPNAQKIQKNHSKMDDLKNDAVMGLRGKLQKKYENYLAEIQEEEKRLKNAKRNAKRKAKAKKTKKTLNFTPTKEQEEWFWGAAPHGGDEQEKPQQVCFHDPTEYGSDGFPTDEEYERKELELGGPVIHCGGGRWKMA